MSDLISRQDAIDTVTKHYRAHDNDLLEVIAYEIKQLPSAQPQRQTGRWQITEAYPHNVYCSECHKRFAQTHWAVWEDGSLPRNFCPNCGSYNGGGA